MAVVDTQAVFWIAQAPEMLSVKAKTAVTRARRQGGLSISDKTLWELAMMMSRGRVNLRFGTARDFLEAVEKHFRVLPISAAIAERSQHFSLTFPRDPTDRLIASTAIIHGLPLITADKQIRESGEVPCIW